MLNAVVDDDVDNDDEFSVLWLDDACCCSIGVFLIC